MTPRFYCSAALTLGAIVALDEASNHHALKVLRLQTGSLVELFNGDGHAYLATLTAAGKRAVVTVEHVSQRDRIAAFERILVQGISTSEKMAWTIEKAVELGVDKIIPLQSHRSKVKLDADRAAGKANRWLDLIKSACAQCGRNTVPEIFAAMPLTTLLSGSILRVDATKLMLQPASDKPLLAALPKASNDSDRRQIVLFCGPESGFDESEVASLQRCGAESIHLGWRILRTETAGLAALASIDAAYEAAVGQC